MSTISKELGILGERIAAEELTKRGYLVIEKNWHFKKDEVDIIAFHEKFLVFIEVKARSPFHIIEPFEAVTRKKQNFLIRAANDFITQRNLKNEIRFDIVSIVIRDELNYTIEIIKDAFYPIVK